MKFNNTDVIKSCWAKLVLLILVILFHCNTTVNRENLLNACIHDYTAQQPRKPSPTLIHSNPVTPQEGQHINLPIFLKKLLLHKT